MAPRNLANLGVTTDWDVGEDGWKPGMDLNLLKMDTLVQARVLARSALPGSPSNGDAYIRSSDEKIAVRDEGAWTFIDPKAGWIVFNVALGYHVKFDGTAWGKLTGLVEDDVTALEGRMDTAEAAITTLDGRVDSLEAGGLDGSEIKALYEAEPDTNAFTDAAQAKLAGIEAGAEANPTGAEIAAAYEAEADRNAFTDAEKAKLAGLEDTLFCGLYASEAALNSAHPDALPGSYAYVDAGTSQPTRLFLWDDGDADWLEVTGGGGAPDAATVKSLYESNPDTNAYTNAEKTKLAGVATGATANATNAQLRDVDTHTSGTTNKVFTAAEQTKLAALDTARQAPAGGADGQVLTKQSATDYDFAWETPAAGGGSSSVTRIGVTADYTLQQADVDGNTIIWVNSVSPVTIYYPNTLTGAQPVTIIQHNTGAVTLAPAAGSGVILRSLNGNLKLAGRYAAATFIPSGNTAAWVVGNLIA